MYKYFPVAQQGVDNDEGHDEKWQLAIVGLKKKNTPKTHNLHWLGIFSWREWKIFIVWCRM